MLIHHIHSPDILPDIKDIPDIPDISPGISNIPEIQDISLDIILLFIHKEASVSDQSCLFTTHSGRKY